MSRNKKLVITLSVMVCAIVLLLVVIFSSSQEDSGKRSIFAPKPEKVSVTIKAVGDNLMHSPVYKSCKTEDGFNFDGLYENIAPYIKDADI